MKTLWVVALVLTSFALPGYAGIPDSTNSFVVPWDSYGQAFMSPGLGGDSLLVIVRDSTGAFCGGVTVEIDISDCANLCVDYPDGLTAVTMPNGAALFDPRVGGCDECDIVVLADGVVLRVYPRVTSSDWSANYADGYTDMNDFATFAFNYPSPPRPYESCLDYNGDGLINSTDSLLFSGCFAQSNTYTCDTYPCVVTPPALDFGTVKIGTFKDKTFRITNTGTGMLAGQVSDTSLHYSIVSGGEYYILDPDESHIVTVRFLPSYGLHTDTVGTGDASCVDVYCTGTGEYAEECVVDPTSINFGTIFVGSSKDTSFIITNTGGSILHGSVSETCNHFSILSGGGAFDLSASETLTVEVRYEPTLDGQHVCIVETGTILCEDVTLSGTGEYQPFCHVWPDTLDFETVSLGGFTDKAFIITNTGGGTLMGSVGEACGQFSIVSGAGAYALDDGDSLDVVVRFEPTIVGPDTCMIETGNPSCPDVTCIGFGDDPPECLVEPTSIDFDTLLVGEFDDTTFIITNTGGGTLDGVVSEICDHYSIVAGGGPYSLSASETLTVTVRFEPTAEGTAACTVETGQTLCADVVATGVGGAGPMITSITDVGNDQGRNVRIVWRRCSHDAVGDTVDIVSYGIYRRQDAYANSAGAEGDDVSTRRAVPMLEGWDFVASVPARGDEVYQYVAPTVCDSTISQGMCWSVFLVSAMTSDPLVYYDSAPDSGYSVDNLSPSVPQGFAVAYNTGDGNELGWDPSPDDDFQYFKVYRGTDPEFTPGPGNLVEMSTGTAWTDSSGSVTDHYKMSAVDFAGNESDATSPWTTTSAAETAVPAEFALYQNVPNPFNPTTAIRYDVPTGGGAVTLRVYDVHGRLVRTLVDETQSPGQKTVLWNGEDDRGQGVATGVYFYRMTAPGFEVARKMVLLQ